MNEVDLNYVASLNRLRVLEAREAGVLELDRAMRDVRAAESAVTKSGADADYLRYLATRPRTAE